MEILKTLSYVGTMDVLFTICKGKTKFTDIMFETELNPGILNRLLKTLLTAGILNKDRDGYHLSERGAKIVLYTLKILDTETEMPNQDYRALIQILSDRVEQQAGTA
ncbi:winged helix-turn-helix domain-containing protein [Methanocella arvoryzae]|uniref:Predicted transcription regulator (ArsR family) n=1 Tax=Methanocella arvoryzae (strain DSM 22066 / NBRC 105507 / MRE50) TaxID=351160 RepID=Q0W0B5_METAR|nr:winged helix-turn-helix domain-containing protein [Methanocella arvoryzae]CAJ38178.1 predicted transcription regulator (ArsR family) [Methanocella arvoryzae MRE50]